jgi:hypothetical protein
VNFKRCFHDSLPAAFAPLDNLKRITPLAFVINVPTSLVGAFFVLVQLSSWIFVQKFLHFYHNVGL